ncbi:MAG: paraquat-inducible protein A [Hyphomicrobiaceae bacterium]
MARHEDRSGAGGGELPAATSRAGRSDAAHVQETPAGRQDETPAERARGPGPPETMATGRALLAALPVRRLALTLLIAAAGFCLYQGITQPIIKLTKLYVWTDEHSLASAVRALYIDGEYFLAGIITIFSIMLPTVKLAYLLVLSVMPIEAIRRRQRTLRWIEGVGKWSMHDVLILALTIVYLKSSGLSKAASMPGAQYFAGSVMLIMLAYGSLKRTARSAGLHHEPPTMLRRDPRETELKPVRRLIVLLLTFAAVATLVLGVTQPTIKLTHVYVFNDEHSVLSAVWALYDGGEWFLAALIFLFSVAFPALKLFYLVVVTTIGTSRPEMRQRTLHRLEWLGKWSMMDVLVLALLIFYVNASAFADATALDGIYFFTASVVLTMIAYGLVRPATRPADERLGDVALALPAPGGGGKAASPTGR